MAARHAGLHRDPRPRPLREPDDTSASATSLLTAPRIFINVGGRAAVPDLPGVDRVAVPHQHRRCSRSTALPEHLVVVGGSYIGLEFAQMYRRFGAEVTVVEMGPRLVAARGRGRRRRRSATSSKPKASPSAPAPSASASRRTRAGVAVGVDCTDGEPEP